MTILSNHTLQGTELLKTGSFYIYIEVPFKFITDYTKKSIRAKGSRATALKKLGNSQEEINLNLCSNISKVNDLPSWVLSTSKFSALGGYDVSVPDKNSATGGLGISFVENIDGNISTFFDYWMQGIKDCINGIYNPSDGIADDNRAFYGRVFTWLADPTDTHITHAQYIDSIYPVTNLPLPIKSFDHNINDKIEVQITFETTYPISAQWVIDACKKYHKTYKNKIIDMITKNYPT